MVRIKHRYLLVNILYPQESDSKAVGNVQVDANLPYVVKFRQPSSDALDGRIMMRIVRDGVSPLFGDYGSGMIAGMIRRDLE